MEESLNPYSNGILTDTAKSWVEITRTYSLNPYSNGILTNSMTDSASVEMQKS